MTALIEDLRTDLGIDFAGACQELARARVRQQRKDTPQNRAAVADCLVRIDLVLDVYLEMWGHGRR
ncbi:MULTISPECIES: hypothetical protein [unclassified Geodermatophilus]|uniref:hypothetical protein n=1 Tax=unclassified Geodermatophilus TaxID=2637632 RepID=UPI003EEF2C47